MKAKQPRFTTLKGSVCSESLQAIKRMGLKRMTAVQALAIPKILEGSDIVCTAKTGSGKTLTFLIPAVEAVRKNKCSGQVQGTTCIVLSPTRELAMQTHGVLKQLIAEQDISFALIIGGENRHKQAEELSRGIDIVVATPGRLCDHMRAREFVYKWVTFLVLDEADKMQQYGFEEELRTIIGMLPEKRQTVMLSATRDEKTESVLRNTKTKAPELVSVGDDDRTATVDALNHGYVLCGTADRLWWLFAVLKKTRAHKVMVFFSSCSSVHFHYHFFKYHCKAPVTCIHGKMAQCERASAIESFYSASCGALLCTDVAARGLHIPRVDWVVQYDPPDDPKEYIHRVGRTARGAAAGNAVLLLRPQEADFLQHLRREKLFPHLYNMCDHFHNLQPMLERAVSQDPQLRRLAQEACEGYVRAFEARRLKTVFNARELDVAAVATSFGLLDAPDIDIRVGFKKKHRDRKRQAATLNTTEKS